MRRGCFTFLGILLAVAIVGAALWWFGGSYLKRALDPDPVSVATASLQGLREQNRLSTFQARYVAVVTSTQSRLGLSAKQTMIMPGNVRYEVDLGKLRQENLRWNPQSNTLSVVLPPIEVVGPDVDLDHIRTYDEGGLLMTFTNAEQRLSEANRHAAQQELVKQAQEPTPMRLAKDATRRAVQQSFTLPLKAAGLDARVEVYFPDEVKAQDPEQWDRSRSVGDIVNGTGLPK